MRWSLCLIVLGLSIKFACATPPTALHLDPAPIDVHDLASVRRGAELFATNCLSCHSARAVRHEQLQDLGLSREQIHRTLMLGGGRMQAMMSPQDAAKWLGSEPPDVSLSARVHGVDWLYTYLRVFYRDPTRPSGWNNLLVPNSNMPHVFAASQGTQILLPVVNGQVARLQQVEAGQHNKEAYDRQVADLVNFLGYIADPTRTMRERIGYGVLAFLALLCLPLLYCLWREYWKD